MTRGNVFEHWKPGTRLCRLKYRLSDMRKEDSGTFTSGTSGTRSVYRERSISEGVCEGSGRDPKIVKTIIQEEKRVRLRQRSSWNPR